MYLMCQNMPFFLRNLEQMVRNPRIYNSKVINLDEMSSTVEGMPKMEFGIKSFGKYKSSSTMYPI
jgi:hypothetical protein